MDFSQGFNDNQLATGNQSFIMPMNTTNYETSNCIESPYAYCVHILIDERNLPLFFFLLFILLLKIILNEFCQLPSPCWKIHTHKIIRQWSRANAQLCVPERGRENERGMKKKQISNFHTGRNIMNGISLLITQAYYFLYGSLFGFILAGAGAMCAAFAKKKKKLSFRKCLSRSHTNDINLWKWTRKPR